MSSNQPIIHGIYSIQCTKIAKIYIGSSLDIHRRWYAHICRLKNGKHHNKNLQEAWHQFEEYDFVFTIVEAIDNEDAYVIQEAEQKWIDSIPSEQRFNIKQRAGLMTPEARSKMHNDEEWRDYLRRTQSWQSLKPSIYGSLQKKKR